MSESWITESSNLTEERLDIVFKRCDVPKRMASDLVGLSVNSSSIRDISEMLASTGGSLGQVIK